MFSFPNIFFIYLYFSTSIFNLNHSLNSHFIFINDLNHILIFILIIISSFYSYCSIFICYLSQSSTSIVLVIPISLILIFHSLIFTYPNLLYYILLLIFHFIYLIILLYSLDVIFI